MIASHLPTLLGAVGPSAPDAGNGEFIKFWFLAIFMILCAIGVARFQRAAYAAICMVGVMIGFAIAYLLNGAQFMGIVQVVVYTGAVMMLFLFVLMLIGIGATDYYRSTSKGARVSAYVLSLLLVVFLGTAAWRQLGTAPFGPADWEYTTMENVSKALFTNHLFTVELSAILLITAALGALLLTHADRLIPVRSQRQVAESKMAAYAAANRHPGQLPPPGVYAESNAFDVPAISGETHEPIEESVPRVLRVRGINRSVGEISPTLAKRLWQTRMGNPAAGIHGPQTSAQVTRSGAWGMPGSSAPSELKQPGASKALSVATETEEKDA
ncbi:hypothetical protein BK816_01840 [Boudabousia tangfeifanii]|uniref:NADH-quinone oxidoreductase subunit J n=1 Tax=Boudabousia tangfeifanii TaxID=1912795 RepID=A0A1D9MJ32_9ACTO|nr:NADH-quinone oxidoreductase subunit J [Boudabousia tangfeifanii]AOZ72190.1 hypothetical protein BK816_01840 [Boudabousia tangfeifanii]